MSQRLKINYTIPGNPQKQQAVFNADDIFRVVFVPDGFNDNNVFVYTSTGSYFTITVPSGDFGASAIALEKAINDALTSNPGGGVLEINAVSLNSISSMITNPS